MRCQKNWNIESGILILIKNSDIVLVSTSRRCSDIGDILRGWSISMVSLGDKPRRLARANSLPHRHPINHRKQSWLDLQVRLEFFFHARSTSIWGQLSVHIINTEKQNLWVFQFEWESFELQQGPEVRYPRGRVSDVERAEGKKSCLAEGWES